MGAWIEMESSTDVTTYDTSLPLWERGLKYIDFEKLDNVIRVAPLVGAWIEISWIICNIC